MPDSTLPTWASIVADRIFRTVNTRQYHLGLAICRHWRTLYTQLHGVVHPRRTDVRQAGSKERAGCIQAATAEHTVLNISSFGQPGCAVRCNFGMRRRQIVVQIAAMIVAGFFSAGLGWVAGDLRPVPTLAALDTIDDQANSETVMATVVGSAELTLSKAISEQAAPVSENTEPEADRDSNARYFNGRPIRPVRTMTMIVTAYSPDARSCGQFADGITASGYSVWTNGMKMAAADSSMLPLGSLISVPGYDGGNVVPVLDRGGAIKGSRLDMLYATHKEARKWGVKRLQVTIWEYAD